MEETESTPSLNLYHLTLEGSKDICASCVGNFAGPKVQSIATITGVSTLGLYVVQEGGVLALVHEQRFSTTLRAMATVASTEVDEPDFLAVTTDAGLVQVLQYQRREDGFGHSWVCEATAVLGKSGTRRSVPGHYIAVDPDSRCLMVAALEKQKFIIPIKQNTREFSGKKEVQEDEDDEEIPPRKVALGSPLEAHKSCIICALVAVDQGGEGNPTFACIEAVPDDTVPSGVAKQLVYYELDVGLHNACRLWAAAVSPTASQLVALPGGKCPSGVIVCSEGELCWMHHTTGSYRLEQTIPVREDLPSAYGPVMISSHSLFRIKDNFFLLAQSEIGDLYRVEMKWKQQGTMEMNIRYFDTLPLLRGFCILKKGFLAAWLESGNHHLYRISKDGYPNDEYLVGNRPVVRTLASGEKITLSLPLFRRHNGLSNLGEVDPSGVGIQHLGPILQADYVPPQQQNPGGAVDSSLSNRGQFVALHGRGPSSCVSTLRYGKHLMQQGDPFELPMAFDSVLTAPLVEGAPHDLRIALTRKNSPKHTLVLRFDSSGVVADQLSSFSTDVETIAITPLACNAGYLQVHTHAIRHIGHGGKSDEWKHELGRDIICAATNPRQLVAAFDRGGIAYFELDTATKRPTKLAGQATDSPVVGIALPPVVSDRLVPFVGIAFANRSLQILSLDRSSKGLLAPVNKGLLENVPADIQSVAFMTSEGSLSAVLGLQNGSILQAAVDPVTGSILGYQPMDCGSAPCSVASPAIGGQHCIAYTTTGQLWLCSSQEGRFNVHPLYPTAPILPGYAPGFAEYRAEETGQRMVAGVAGNRLTLYTLSRPEDRYVTHAIPLPVMGRRFVRHPLLPSLTVVMGSEARCPPTMQKINEENESGKGTTGRSPYPAGSQCSVLQVVELPSETFDRPVGVLTDALELSPPNRSSTALCITVGSFPEFGRDPVVVVGMAENFKQNPMSHDGGMLLAYRFEYQQQLQSHKLRHVHLTQIVEDIPTAIQAYQGFLLVGHANPNHGLQVFTWGKNQFLKKFKVAFFESPIVSISCFGNSIAVGDSVNSVFFLRYRPERRGPGFSGQIIAIADEPVQRRVVTTCFVDADTVLVSDKFGSISALRLPTEMVSEEAVQGDANWDDAVGNETFSLPKLSQVSAIYIGDIVVSLTPISLSNGSSIVLYSTIRGSLGVLMPFQNDAQYTQLYHFQKHLRSEVDPVIGLEHHAFRSKYYPTSTVIDGDYLEQFYTLPLKTREVIQKRLLDELRRTNNQLERKKEQPRAFGDNCDSMLQEMRTLVSLL